MTFYNTFLRERWLSDTWPLPFEFPRKELLLFGIVRGRIDRIPRGVDEKTAAAFGLKQSADLTAFRLGMNKAALNKTLQSIIDWPFQIVKLKVGVMFAVQTVETSVSDGVAAEEIKSFVEAKKKHLRHVYSAIKPEKHTAQEMEDLFAKSEIDDQLFDDFDHAVEDMKRRVEASRAVRRLEGWASPLEDPYE